MKLMVQTDNMVGPVILSNRPALSARTHGTSSLEKSRPPVPVVDGRFLRGIDSRAKLIRAAILQFSMFGADGASIRQIAKEADVAFQSIAYYFGSKQELWLAVIEELFDLAHKQLSELQTPDIGLE